MKTKNNIENLIKKALEESLSKGDSPIVEATLSKAQLDKREDIIKDLKKNKKELVKRYGKDAEAVMYGRATNLAKKAVSEMNKEKLKELVRKSLMNEADIETMADKIGGEDELSLASNLLDDFESKLKSHDWFYMMSDDNRAYTKGSAEESELKKLAKQLDNMGYGDDAAEVYDQYNKFDKVSFESYITPPQPFVPMYKRKQMGLDETEFSKEFDNDPALKGGQKKLPDALQKSIIKKEKGEMKENMSQYKVGDKIKWSSPKGEVEDEIVGIDGIYLKLKSGGSIPYQSVVSEDLDLGHEDNEPHMLKGDLYRIGKYAMELYQMVDEFEGKGEVDFPHWWQAKIINAKDALVGAKHYLDFETKEPEIDAMVGIASDEEILDDAPVMEASRSDINFVNNKWHSIKDKFNKAADAQGLDFNVYYYDNRSPFPSIWPGLKAFGPADDRGIRLPDPDKEQNLISNFNSVLQSIGVNDLVAKQSKTYPAILMPKSPVMEGEVTKVDKLAAKIAKALKDPKYKSSEDQNNIKQARKAMNDDKIEAAEKIIKPYND
jgi:hypothetical protein